MTLGDLIGKHYFERLLPGTRIKMASGEWLLVGDINQLGGVCDDCTTAQYDGEVVDVVPPTALKEKP